MDGSVDPINHNAGAGFTASIRVTDNASSLQAETIATMGALAPASLNEGHVVIHTDFRLAIDRLLHSMPNNIYLLPTVLTIA